MPPLLESQVTGFPCRRGKVRDVYDLGDRLVIVATDRISAFDWVLPTPIPDKGRVLTALTLFWLETLAPPNHLLSTDLRDMPPAFAACEELEGRTCLVRKARVAPIECVVRGWLAGSGWKEYRETGAVCGVALPAGLRQSEQLPAPIFTPATKEEHGHDQNISFEEAAKIVGFRDGGPFARPQHRLVPPGGGLRRWTRPDPGGHEIRVGLDAGRGTDSGGRGADAGQLALLAGGRLDGRGATRRRSTSNTSATGWRRAAGTRTARRRRCPRTWCGGRGRSTSRRLSG